VDRVVVAVDPGAEEVAAGGKPGCRRDEIPETETHPIARSERFAGPIGADSEGNDPEDSEQPRRS
jgi:hypothetical protein